MAKFDFAREAARLLKEIEYSGTERWERGPACPVCRTPADCSHDFPCRMRVLLREAEVLGYLEPSEPPPPVYEEALRG